MHNAEDDECPCRMCAVDEPTRSPIGQGEVFKPASGEDMRCRLYYGDQEVTVRYRTSGNIGLELRGVTYRQGD